VGNGAGYAEQSGTGDFTFGDGAANDSSVFVNSDLLSNPSNIVAVSNVGKVLWKTYVRYPTTRYAANDVNLMYSVDYSRYHSYELEFVSATNGSSQNQHGIHRGAAGAWAGAYSGGFVYGTVYTYGPGRSPNSTKNTVDVDIFDSYGHLRQGIALNDPYYDGPVDWSSTGNTLWVGVPIMSSGTETTMREAIWKVTATSIQRYTLSLPSGDTHVIGVNSTDVMFYGPPVAVESGPVAPTTEAWSFTTTAQELWDNDLDISSAVVGPNNMVYTDVMLGGNRFAVMQDEPSLAINGATGVFIPMGYGGVEFWPWYVGKTGAIGFYGNWDSDTGNVVMMTAKGQIVRTFIHYVPATQQALILSSLAGVEILSPSALGSRAITVPTGC
jgi:hypothetical protein